uniref:Uncharacterized protein n=1 Tax=Rhizophora mucronata TaxID=61149 RepID=A0A2P2QCC3_RHIMU
MEFRIWPSNLLFEATKICKLEKFARPTKVGATFPKNLLLKRPK